MTVDNLEKQLKNGELNNIYLFYGEEIYLLESCVKKIKKLFGELIPGINYISINETNVEGLISDIETPAFGYKKKLIIIKNSGILKNCRGRPWPTSKRECTITRKNSKIYRREY